MLPFLDRATSATRARPTCVRARAPAPRSTRPTSGSRRALGRRARARSSSRRGGTEANNLALKGAAWAGKARGHRIVTSAVEHHAVGHTLRYLEKFGFEIVELPVDRYGRVDPDQLEAALNDKTILVVDHARQQRGRHDPADRRDRGKASATRTEGILFHVDAVQAAPYARPSMSRRSAPTCSSLAAPQVRGTQGGRRPLRPARDAHPGAAAGRHPGAPPPGRHRERRRGGRDGRRVRAGRRGAARDRRGGSARQRDRLRDRRPRRGRRRADRPSPRAPARASCRSSSATPTAPRSRCRSTSRGSPARSDRRARPARPSSATC